MSAAVVATPTPDRLGRALQEGTLSGLRQVSDAAACLMPLLSALNWHGESRDIAEAAPHFAGDLDIAGLRRVLARLNYATRRRPARLGDIDPRVLPCLFVPENGPVMAVLGVEGGAYQILKGDTGELTTGLSPRLRGEAYLVSQLGEASAEVSGRRWSSEILGRFRRLLLLVFSITGVTSILALSIPLFVMSLYDKIIPSKSLDTLGLFAVGILLILAVDAGLRLLRARLIAYVGARTDMILGTSTFDQILHLPLAMTERTSAGTQVARQQQFEVLREFFVGPLAGVAFELPFILLSIGVIAIIAGPLAWVPVVLAVVFLVVGAVALPVLGRANRVASAASSRRQEFLMESVANMRAVKESGGETIWTERHRKLSADQVFAHHKVARTNAVLQTISQQFMLVAGIATLGLGALSVMHGDMTMGALVATMALTWRVISPLQTGLLSLSRFDQVRTTLRQVDRLMALRPEKDDNRARRIQRAFRGSISFNRVSMRYTPDGQPALLGVSFKVEPGEIVAVTGASGSGKSTILRLILGLYVPQGGAVSLDGIDIRQLDVAELRNAISYVPQSTRFYHGTIAQNLRLANPTATDDQLINAARQAKILDDINDLPNGFETRLTDAEQQSLPRGFLRGLCLAQAYVKGTNIYLMDEPASHLDHQDDEAFMEFLDGVRGRATVLLSTHRPSHIRLADKLLVLRDGGVAYFGSPIDVQNQGTGA